MRVLFIIPEVYTNYPGAMVPHIGVGYYKILIITRTRPAPAKKICSLPAPAPHPRYTRKRLISNHTSKYPHTHK